MKIIEGKAPKGLQSAAILTIKEPGKFHAKGRQRLAKWLRDQAAMLVREGENYTTGRFTARYLYSPK